MTTEISVMYGSEKVKELDSAFLYTSRYWRWTNVELSSDNQQKNSIGYA